MDEEKRKLREDADTLKRQLDSSLGDRMALEKELLMARARLESLSTNAEELERLRRVHTTLQDDLSKVKGDHSEQASLNKELLRQAHRHKDDYQRLKACLEDERKELLEFKVSSEKNLVRLRTAIEEERAEHRTKVTALEDELARKRREKDDLKVKCRAALERIERLTRPAALCEPGEGQSGVSGDEHRRLKKSYKELRQRHAQLAAMLNECTLDGKRSKEQ